jgi:hypothetical protein
MKSPKDFALEQIAPYYANPSTCGFDGSRCQYLTDDGKMCVAGKNLLEPDKYKLSNKAITHLIDVDTDIILKPESRGILTTRQWQILQYIHDDIAMGTSEPELNARINMLGFFTLEELKEAAKNISKI